MFSGWHKKEEYQFKIFTNRREREEIKDISFSLARYLHENNIQTLVLIDVKARLAYLGLIRAWAQLYPHEKRPQIYFVNPEGLDADTRFNWKIKKDMATQHKHL